MRLQYIIQDTEKVKEAQFIGEGYFCEEKRVKLFITIHIARIRSVVDNYVDTYEIGNICV